MEKTLTFVHYFKANHNKDYSVVKTLGAHRPSTVGFFMRKSVISFAQNCFLQKYMM